ncbi:MAG: hypothetical protein Q8L76_17190, partial [Cypionkella sp.]|nr:hypothetical protein [Cypionkella sp.]
QCAALESKGHGFPPYNFDRALSALPCLKRVLFRFLRPGLPKRLHGNSPKLAISSTIRASKRFQILKFRSFERLKI